MNRKILEMRDDKIISEYKQGTKLELIQGYFGLSRQRIYQILEKYNVKKNRTLDKIKK